MDEQRLRDLRRYLEEINDDVQALQERGGELPQWITQLRRAVTNAEAQVPDDPEEIVVVRTGDSLEETRVGNVRVSTMLLIMMKEQELARPIYYRHKYIYQFLYLPELPQVPDDLELAAGEQRYEFFIGDAVALINPNWVNMSNRYRAALQGAEILEMREAMSQVLDGAMRRLRLPAHYRRYVEREITFYDPRLQISKSRSYRRIYERRHDAPYFRDVLVLYVLEMGRIHPKVRAILAEHDSLWMIQGTFVHHMFREVPGASIDNDLVIGPDGKPQKNPPLKAIRRPPPIVDDMVFYQVHRRWPNHPLPAIEMEIEDLREANVGLQIQVGIQRAIQRYRNPGPAVMRRARQRTYAGIRKYGRSIAQAVLVAGVAVAAYQYRDQVGYLMNEAIAIGCVLGQEIHGQLEIVRDRVLERMIQMLARPRRRWYQRIWPF